METKLFALLNEYSQPNVYDEKDGYLATAKDMPTAERFAEACNQHDALKARVAQLEEALLKLANESAGFISMANPNDHGWTNMNILELRIKEARAALKTEADNG